MTTSTQKGRRPFILDMETADPDDFLTLLLLLGHPEVELVAVTVSPGTREQIGLVKQAVALFRDVDERRESNNHSSGGGSSSSSSSSSSFIPVGAYNINHDKDCVSPWHYRAYPALQKLKMEPDGEGWQILKKYWTQGVTLVEGAAPKNVGALLCASGYRVTRDRIDRTPARPSSLRPGGGKEDDGEDEPRPGQDPDFDPSKTRPKFGKFFFQGGFAGDGVVPPELQLKKFAGMKTCPSFNPGGARNETFNILCNREEAFEELRFVSKNVCHGVMYGPQLHALYKKALGLPDDRERPASTTSTTASATAGGPSQKSRMILSQQLIYQGMDAYLSKKADGKAFHDPLAACCGIHPETVGAQWAEVEMFYLKGGWGCDLKPGSSLRILVQHSQEQLEKTLLPQLISTDPQQAEAKSLGGESSVQGDPVRSRTAEAGGVTLEQEGTSSGQRVDKKTKKKSRLQ